MMQERLERRQSRNVNSSQYVNTPASQNNSERIDSRHTYLDNISYNERSVTQENHNFEKKVENITSTMTSDPILAGILKDTALTTLQEQTSAESSRGAMPVAKGDMAARAVSQTSPDQIFGQKAASKWAALAFSNNKTR